MKGIILAGGHGSRLFPLTKVVSKQLLPVYDKPMIYYPLSMLMLAGITEILVISDPVQLPAFKNLLNSGEQWGIKFTYAEQSEPKGIAEAFIIGKEFIDGEPVCLILGDNIFYGHNMPKKLLKAAETNSGALIFAYEVRDPERYGVVDFNDDGIATKLEEKPKNPSSKYAVPGLYFYDSFVSEYAENLKPSSRGELEVTDLNRVYLEKGELRTEILGRGVAWLDAGKPESLLQASQFIQAVEERQGMMISCPEEIAYKKGFISQEQLSVLIDNMGDNEYRENLLRIIET